MTFIPMPDGSLSFERRGDLGIPSRDTLILKEHYAEALRILEEDGCCAWRGRTVCGDKPTMLVIGGTTLYFHTYRSLVVEGMAIAFMCQRHLNNPQIDMHRSLRRSQERERLKFKRMVEHDR